MVRSWLVRGLVALGLVVGLVGMHELARPAALGGHGQIDHAIVQATPQHADPHWDDQHAALTDHDPCHPLQPDWPSWLPLLTCVALLSFAALLLVDPNLGERRTHLLAWWRAPPHAGRVCLVRVCVSRT